MFYTTRINKIIQITVKITQVIEFIVLLCIISIWKIMYGKFEYISKNKTHKRNKHFQTIEQNE